jgi:glyoxylase-like metal-dependent hydrolase (beta-lactamase superfamily II)
MGHVHEDHMAGLHRLPGVPVHVHEADLEAARSWEGLSRHYGYPQAVLDGFRAKIERDFWYAPRPDAIGYRDGATWDLGGLTVRAIHMPGHTAGHCVLMVEPHGIAFIGDIDLSSFGPYYGDATSNLAEFRATLKAVAALPASVWITSHHKGAITSRTEFDSLLAAFEARIGQRSERLLEMIGADARSLDDLVTQRLLYPTSLTEGFVDSVERHTIAQHLAELQAQGRVLRRDDGRFRVAV